MSVVFSWDINKHCNNNGSTMECEIFVGQNFSVIHGLGGWLANQVFSIFNDLNLRGAQIG